MWSRISTPSYDFMVSCLIKLRDNFNIYLSSANDAVIVANNPTSFNASKYQVWEGQLKKKDLTVQNEVIILNGLS